MYGLSVRWSLASAPADVAEQLRSYVTGTSLARFTGMAGLHFKTWRMVEAAWFEGTYVFDTAGVRDEFAEQTRRTALDMPGTAIIGSPPISVEPFEVVAVAEGGSGFTATGLATAGH